MGFSFIRKTASTGSSATGALVAANSLQPHNLPMLQSIWHVNSLCTGGIRREIMFYNGPCTDGIKGPIVGLVLFECFSPRVTLEGWGVLEIMGPPGWRS